MKEKKEIAVVFLSALLFTCLFYRQDIGLNLLAFEAFILGWLLYSGQFELSGRYQLTLGMGLIWTALFTVVTYSLFSLIINLFTFFIFTGLIIYPQANSLVTSAGLSFANTINSQVRFFEEVAGVRMKGRKTGEYLWKARVFIIPVLIISLFILMYKISDPYFEHVVIKTGLFIKKIVDRFDLLILVVFISGLLISNFIFLRTAEPQIIKGDLESGDILLRIKSVTRKYFSMTGLRDECLAAVFLLAVLNLVLLILNVLDIWHVWFNFKWHGQYLKQFVHEGTYLLILSILVSMALVLWFFRGNLNFYHNNKLMRYLSYCWLAQNVILAISVGIRNFWYIHYFSLAYKRIGVIIFLILTVHLLISVFIKVRDKKTPFYLFKTNLYALLLILMISSAVDWDSMIAKYNFSHCNQSFLHLNYMATLSDKALPHLDKPLSVLKMIDKIQKEKFPFEEKFMTPEEYHQIISKRKTEFKKKWELKNFLSWNLPEYLAYRQLFSK